MGGKMTKTYAEILKDISQRVARVRNMQTFLKTRLFERVWKDCNDEEKEQTLDLIKNNDRMGLYRFCVYHPSIDLGEKPRKILIELAKEYRVPNYARMNKTQLLIFLRKRIQDAEHEGNAQKTGTNNRGTTRKS